MFLNEGLTESRGWCAAFRAAWARRSKRARIVHRAPQAASWAQPVGFPTLIVETSAMPTYQYRCEKCGKLFERSEHIAEHADAHPPCPDCKSTAVQRVLTAFIAKTSRKS